MKNTLLFLITLLTASSLFGQQPNYPYSTVQVPGATGGPPSAGGVNATQYEINGVPISVSGGPFLPLAGGAGNPMSGALYTPSIVTGNPSNPQVTIGPSTTPPTAWTLDLTTQITALNSLSSPSLCLTASQVNGECLVYSGVFTGLGTTGTTGTIVIYSTSSSFTGSISGNILTISATSGGFGLSLGQTIAGSGVTSATITGFGDVNTTGGTGTYIISGAAQTVGSEAMTSTGSGAPANATFMICPFVAIKTSSASGGAVDWQVTAETPGTRVWSGSNLLSTAATGANAQLTCDSISLLSGTNFSFDIAAVSVSGGSIGWETEPMVYRIR